MNSTSRSWKIVATAVTSGALAAAALGGVALAADDARPTPPAITVEAPLSDADKALVTSTDTAPQTAGAASPATMDSTGAGADTPVSAATVASAASAASAVSPASPVSADSPPSPVSADSPPSPVSPATPDAPAAADTPASPETPQTP